MQCIWGSRAEPHVQSGQSRLLTCRRSRQCFSAGRSPWRKWPRQPQLNPGLGTPGAFSHYYCFFLYYGRIYKLAILTTFTVQFRGIKYICISCNSPHHRLWNFPSSHLLPVPTKHPLPLGPPCTFCLCGWDSSRHLL